MDGAGSVHRRRPVPRGQRRLAGAPRFSAAPARVRLRQGVLTFSLVVATGFASAGCTSLGTGVGNDPIDAASESLTTLVERERPDAVATYVFDQSQARVTFIKDGFWQEWTVDNTGHESERQALSAAPSRSVGPSVREAVALARQLRHGCPNEQFSVTVAVVSNTSTLATLTCSQAANATATLLNGSALAALSGGWTEKNLAIVWQELDLIMDGHEVQSMSLKDGRALVQLRPVGGGSPSCAVSWTRQWGDPAAAATRCTGLASSRPLDLRRFSAARVSAAVQAAGDELGVKDTAVLRVDLVNTSRETGVDVRSDARSKFVSAKDW